MRLALVTACTLAAALAAGAHPARAQDTAKPASEGATTLRLGTLAPEGTPWADLLTRFEAIVESATGGATKVKLYLNARQGDEGEMLEKTAAGKLDGGGFTSSGLASTIPEMQVFELPFLFANDAEADAAMDDREVRDEMSRRFEAKGLKLVCWAVNGWADLGSTRGPATSLAEIRAAKPWARATGARLSFWKALGATPATLPVPDVAKALEAGTVDLYDTTPLFAAAAQWSARTKHWTDSNHVYQPAALVVRLAWWKSLPLEHQAKIEDGAKTLQTDARKAVRGLDAQFMDEFLRQGMTMYHLGADARDAVVKSREATVKELVAAGAFPQKLYDRVVLAAASARSKDPAQLAKERAAERIAIAEKGAAERPKVPPIEQGITALEEMLRDDPKSFEATWRMAKLHYYLGRYGQDDKRIPRYEKGIEWAKKAIALDEKRVEGHWWIAILYGVFGEANGITSSLFLVGDMEKALERAKQIDPMIDGAGPLRVLGRLKFKLPWVAGGSNKKSLEYLREALQKAPEFPYNYTYLAETLIDEDEEDEARKVLNKLIAATPDPKWRLEFEESKEEAKKLLKKLE
jgi:TRAP-type C4-dicarboxylate transport system substrate-binding protein